MQVLVIYDVENDRIRLKVANACKDYGLQRVQYSAFKGELSCNRMEELYFRLKKTLGVDVGNIQIYPMCEKDLKLAKGTERCVDRVPICDDDTSQLQTRLKGD